MALPGRGEMRTRRGAEVTVGVRGSGGKRSGSWGEGRAGGSAAAFRGGPVPAVVALPGPSGRPPPGRRWGPQGCAGSGVSRLSSPPRAEQGKRSSVS